VKLLAATLGLFLAAAAPAAADSIVYVKQGDLYLTSPDGSRGYQLTRDGGYSSPSQADDGTIGAIRDKQFVRLGRSGRPLGPPVPAMGTSGGAIGGPYEARISRTGPASPTTSTSRRRSTTSRTTSAGSTPAPTRRGRGPTTSRRRRPRASTSAR
jgi:hypothetical protein